MLLTSKPFFIFAIGIALALRERSPAAHGFRRCRKKSETFGMKCEVANGADAVEPMRCLRWLASFLNSGWELHGGSFGQSEGQKMISKPQQLRGDRWNHPLRTLLMPSIQICSGSVLDSDRSLLVTYV